MANIWCELNTMQIQNQSDADAYRCLICSNNFTSPIQLTVHCVVLHGLLPCMQCLKLFGTEHLLSEHMGQQHNQLSYNCPECPDSTFTVEKDLCFHMTRKHFKKQCTFCTSTISYDDFQSHMKTAHKITNTTAAATAASAATSENVILFENSCAISDDRKQFHCLLCQDKKCLNQLDKLILHFLYFHKLSLPSVLRCILADSRIDFDQLMDANGNSVDASLSHANQCSVCSSIFSWSIPHLFHQIYCHGSSYCANCQNCHEDVRSCRGQEMPAIKFCDEDDCNIQNVIHLKTEHSFTAICDFSKKENGLINLQNDCNFCGEHLSQGSVLSLDNLIDHFRLMHKFNAIAILRCLHKRNDEMPMANVSKCHTSGKRSLENSLEKSVLVERELEVTSIEYRMDFATSVIRYVYSSESDYDSSDPEDNDKTVQSCPAGDRIYRCNLCGQRSRSKYVHVDHMVHKHGFHCKTPEFRCNVCEKHFTSAKYLKRHNQNAHHKPIGNEGDSHAKRFKCAFCEFGCNGKSKMR